MDESWRMRMGMPRRRSTEETPSYLKHPIFAGGSQTLNPINNNGGGDDDDFSDVFGGPPRTLHLSRANFFQDEIFIKAGEESMFGCRSSSSKKIDDVFGFEDDDDLRFRTRSQSRSTKSKSSSNEPSPRRTDDASFLFSGFASRLKPVNVPGRWNPRSVAEQAAKQKMQHFSFNGNVNTEKQCQKRNCDADARMMMMMLMSSNNLGFSRRILSPERGMGELDSLANLKQAVEDYELSSPPSSAKSSVCQEQEAVRNEDCIMADEIVEDDDDIMSSYVIEINDFSCTDQREESVEAVGVDEAIAWAKEKYQNGIQHEKDQSPDPPGPEVPACSQKLMDEDLPSSSVVREAYATTSRKLIYVAFDFNPVSSILRATEDETQRDEEQKAMELLDEDIKLWSAYKETNIQLLLSTLHHILWSSSGWSVVSLADIIDSSQVKKAYQKARLCLHPDKLQQRGATPLQKYVAAEAFSILQTAWEAFISQNSF